MNEKIKELLNEATSGLEPDLSLQRTVTLNEMQKFAELIIQDCAALAKSKSEYIQSMETDDRGDKAQIHSLAWQFEEFGYEIKKHFGVDQEVAEPSELHTCPYAEEIHGDYETLCDCDEEQRHQCAMDI